MMIDLEGKGTEINASIGNITLFPIYFILEI